MRGSFFSEHPWLTFFLGLTVVHGVVTVVRGYSREDRQPRLKPHTRGTYR